jgi:hypothetical protein
VTDIEQFLALTGQRAFQQIDDLVDLLDEAHYWKPEWLSTTSRRAKKAKIRALIKQAKDPSGWPLWASIMVQPPQGTPYRVYQQELFMDRDDYRQVITYHVAMAQHHMGRAEGYRDHDQKRFGGEQLSLPWE